MALKNTLVIDQGANFSTNIAVNDANNNPMVLTGYTANAQMRRSYTSLTAYEFDTTVSNGNIVLSMSSEATANVGFGRYVYDVIINDGSNNITRVIEGIVTVNPAVTK